MARSGRPPIQVVLDEQQRDELTRRTRAATSAVRDALRARIILACADGCSAKIVAARVGTCARFVERWRGRFLRHGLDGLRDERRRGHAPKFGSVTRLELIALACEPERRTIDELVDEAVRRGLVASIGWSSVQPILSQVDLRPHLVDGWVHSPDPQFREKVTAITDLYLHPPPGSILCAFEVHTGKVHVIWDNLNIHFDGDENRWTAFNARHGQRFVFHYTPKHASWVNQVECFFSILERKCLRNASFSSTTELRDAVLGFIARYNETARPFRWTFAGYPLQTGVKLAEAA